MPSATGKPDVAMAAETVMMNNADITNQQQTTNPYRFSMACTATPPIATGDQSRRRVLRCVPMRILFYRSPVSRKFARHQRAFPAYLRWELPTSLRDWPTA